MNLSHRCIVDSRKVSISRPEFSPLQLTLDYKIPLDRLLISKQTAGRESTSHVWRESSRLCKSPAIGWISHPRMRFDSHIYLLYFLSSMYFSSDHYIWFDRRLLIICHRFAMDFRYTYFHRSCYVLLSFLLYTSFMPYFSFIFFLFLFVFLLLLQLIFLCYNNITHTLFIYFIIRFAVLYLSLIFLWLNTKYKSILHNVLIIISFSELPFFILVGYGYFLEMKKNYCSFSKYKIFSYLYNFL